MKKLKWLATAVSSMAALGIMNSAIASMPIPLGWYIEGNGGYTHISNSNYGTPLSISSPGWGWNVDFGYKFMPYFAGEFGYTYYAKAKIKSTSTQVGQATNQAYYLAAKGILPVSDSGFEFFGKLGIARIKTHIVNTNPTYISMNGVTLNAGTFVNTGAYFGVGGDYSFTPNISLNGQWNRARGSSTSGYLDLYSIGLTYIFG